MSLAITQASGGHDCFWLLGPIDLLPFLQIPRSLRLVLVCPKWVTAVLACAVHALSNQGLILPMCSFITSQEKVRHMLAQTNGAVCGLMRPQDHRVNRCPFQNLNSKKTILWSPESGSDFFCKLLKAKLCIWFVLVTPSFLRKVDAS